MCDLTAFMSIVLSPGIRGKGIKSGRWAVAWGTGSELRVLLWFSGNSEWTSVAGAGGSCLKYWCHIQRRWGQWVKGQMKVFEIVTFDTGNHWEPRKPFKLGCKRWKESPEELNPAMHQPCQARQLGAAGVGGKEPEEERDSSNLWVKW